MQLKSFHILVAYLIAEMFSFVFLIPYFLSQGYDIKSVLVFFLVVYLSASAAIALGNKSNPKYSILFALGIRILTGLYLFLSGPKIDMPLVGILTGLMFFLFWVPLNYSYLLNISKNHASESWKYSFTPIIIGIIIPIIAGLVSNYYGLRFMFLFGILFYAVSIFVTLNFEGKSIKYNLRDAIKKYSRLRTLTFLEGLWQPTFFVGIPLVTATYLNSGLKFGMFYSYLGIASAVAALFIAKYSDWKMKRKVFIYGITFLLAFITFLIAFHDGFTQWRVIAGILYFLHPLAVTFFLTMFMDMKRRNEIPECIVAREYILNFGRACGTVILLLFSIYGGSFLYGYLILGLSMLAYPFFVKLKKIYPVEGSNVQD